MSPLARDLAAAALDVGLCGAARLRIGDDVTDHVAGMAHRALGAPNGIDTQFAIASGTKGFTAVVVARLVESGTLSLATTARSLLGHDLPLVDERVTVEHLLAHRSGIGDYLDEDVPHDPDDYLMPVPVQELSTTEDYVAVLGGHPQKFPPGDRFGYCNGGYVLLALIAERASGVPFHELVAEHVCAPAGMHDTAFLRSDELPGRAALGYLDPEGLRTNVFHLPVRGSGDGGIYTTVADIDRFWDALLGGSILAHDRVADLLQPRTTDAGSGMGYGLGFWLLQDRRGVELHGFDSGVGFVSVRHRGGEWAFTVVTNTSRGAWPMRERLLALLPS